MAFVRACRGIVDARYGTVDEERPFCLPRVAA